MADSSSTSSFKVSSFVRKAIALLLLIIAIDWATGKLLNALFFHERYGDDANTNYAIFQSNAGVFIIGPSLAKGHYDTRIFKDSLGISTFNAGHDAQSYFYDLLMTKTLIKRHHPSIIILEAGSLNFKGYENDRLDVLLPYYKKFPEEAAFILDLKDKRTTDSIAVGRKLWGGYSERVKMLSGIYPFNSQLIPILEGYTDKVESYDGYKPLRKVLTEKRKIAMLRKDSINSLSQQYIDKDKVEALKQIFRIAKDNNVKLIIARSPSVFHNTHPEEDSIIYNLCKEYNVPFFDYLTNENFREISLFADNHLNITGATIYSKLLAHDIKQYCQKIDLNANTTSH